MTDDKKYYVYVMAGEDEMVVKIGITSDIKKRRASLNTGRNDDPLRIRGAFVGTRDACQRIESQLKLRLSNRIASHEMYRISPDEAIEILSEFSELKFFDIDLVEVDLTQNKELAKLIREYRGVYAEYREVVAKKEEIADQIKLLVGEKAGVYYCKDGRVSVSMPVDIPMGVIDDLFFKENKNKVYYGKIRFEPRVYNPRYVIR